MGKKSKPPPPPDYTAAAEKTAASQNEAATRGTWANRPDINTPWGSQTWTPTQTVDPATGQTVTKWAQNTTLAPDQQKALDQQMALQNQRSTLAGSLMGQVADRYSQPLSFAGAPAAGQSVQGERIQGAGQGIIGSGPAADAQERQRIEMALMQRMQPTHQDQSQSLETQLANRGIAPGSSAYGRERQRLMDQQSRERFNAMEMGGQEMARLHAMGLQNSVFANQAQGQGFAQGMAQSGQNFQQDLAASQYQNQLRQQGIAEQMTLRNSGLNEMNSLIGGQQVSMPNMPSFNTASPQQGTNYYGAAGDQYAAAMNAFNAKQANSSGIGSGIGSLIGGVGGFMLGGPMGAMAGSSIGGSVGGSLG